MAEIRWSRWRDHLAASQSRLAEGARGKALPWAAILPWATLAVALALAGAIYVSITYQLWFFQDDWDFLLTRGNVPGHSLGLLAPHGDHWSTGPILIYRALFTLFGLQSYAPWAVTTVLIHLMVAFASAVVIRRMGGQPWLAVLMGIGVGYLGAGADIFTVDNAMNHSGALLFGLIALTLIPPSGRFEDLRLAAVWGCLIGSLMFAGTGVVVVAFVVFFVALSRGFRDGAVVVSAPLAVYLIWFVTLGRGGSAGVLDPWTLYLEIPSLVVRGISHAIAESFLLGNAGFLGAVALAVIALLPSAPNPRLRALAAAGLLAVVLQFIFIGISRIGFGPEVVEVSRYVYITMVLLIGVVAGALSQLVCHLRPHRPILMIGIVAFVMAGYMIHGVSEAIAYARGQEPITTIWRDRMLALVEAHDDGQQILTTSTEDWLNADLDPRLVVMPAVRDVLPDDRSTPEGRLDAEAIFMIGIDDSEFGLWSPTEVSFAGAEFTSKLSQGCRDFFAPDPGAVLRVHSASGTEVGITGPMTSVRTQLERGGLASSVVRTWDTPSPSVYIATSARDADLLLTLNAAGEYTVCSE